MRELSIAFGNSCMAKRWSNKQVSWEALTDILENTIRTPESVEEYQKMKRSEKEAAKDKGGFVGGQLRDGRRKREAVVSRSMLTLDVDHASVGFIDQYEMLCSFSSALYTTHGHTPEAPRIRLVVPLTRDVTPDEYQAIARYYAAEWGIDQFDECSYRPHQLMYWPTTPSNGEYVYRKVTGKWLDPDMFLSAHPLWRDCSLLPTSKRESEVKKYDGKKAEDPLKKEGIVGVFCRCYGIQDVMECFLSDVYEPSEAIPGRYQYKEADSAAGVQIYDDKFSYSHHASDPACGMLLNAFDLVRVHRFPDDDEKKSFHAMAEFAAGDDRVKLQSISEKQKIAAEEFDGEDPDEWKKQLEYEKKSMALKNTLHNITLIMENDAFLKSIVFNQLADGMEIKGDVPWKHPEKFWRDADDAQLICYVDENYGSFSARNYDIAVTKVVDDRSYHPIREYFSSLPEWDGVKRVDTLLIDYLGAADTPYVRAITRKLLCAAYMRVHFPGIKFDTMLVLNGDQGIGKSTLIAKLGGEWYSDSLNLSDMNDKTAAEKLQGYWIMEIGELAGMKKADLDKVKAFISRQDDKYRASFGRRVTPHPRQCIFFGTTNSENGYLRDITGNRRYWNVKVPGQGKYKPWDLDPETAKQIWAETMIYAKAGEKLFLPPELEIYAREEQRSAMEQDDREGLVQEYLEMLLPKNWDSMDVYKRREFVREVDDPTRPNGSIRRMEVSNMEIWCECFGKPKEDMKPADSYTIAAIMAHMDGWNKTGKAKILPIYGKQRIYRRTEMKNRTDSGTCS